MSGWRPSLSDTPFQRLGGADAVRALDARFYDRMGEREQALAALHKCDAQGRVSDESRERFALFLIGWLGGPQEYVALHGHPRLRMRHAQVPVDVAMRDAWLRCMAGALEGSALGPEQRSYLEERFADVANFLRNVPEEASGT